MEKLVSIQVYRRGRILPRTIRDRIQRATPGNQIRANDTNEDGQPNNASPPADDIANEVDLLVGSIVRPEADTADEERPVDRSTSVGMRCRQTSVVLEHEYLQLGKLLEEVHVLGSLDRPVVLITTDRLFAIYRRLYQLLNTA